MKLPALPQGRLARFGVQALGILIAVLALWVLAAFIWHRWTEGPRQKAEAVTQQETARAAVAVATDAVIVLRERDVEHVRIREITRENDHAIKAAAGADSRAPAVADALHDSLCRRAVYSGEPDCAALLGHSEGVGPARSDHGRTAADQ